MKRFILLLFLAIFELSYSQDIVFKPFRKLYTIQTEKFEIIFPMESRRTAEKLAKIADGIYDEYSKLLNSKVNFKVNGRIPITITPDINRFNAYSTVIFPYSAITIYDTAGINEATYNMVDTVSDTFLHELVHLLSLNSENAGTQTKVFGNWATLQWLNIPMFMIEGISVSIESYKGFGRANDPLIKQILRQDIYEGKFKTPIQASDFWSKRPYALYYEYGGLLSKYLQERFGIEKYNELWNVMRKKLSFSFLIYNSGFYGAFKKVYGMNFLEVWGDFQNSLTLENINPSEELRVNNKETYISDLTSYGDKVYYIDNNIGALYSYKYKRNESNEKKDLKLEFYIDRTSESLDISSDGKRALFVSRTYNGGLYKYIVKEYDLEKKKRTKRKWENIQYARFFKNGIIGIGKDLHNPILIYIDENNNKEILLEANDNFSYISPTVIDDNNIALIISDYGIRHIAIFNYQTKTLQYIETKDDSLNFVRYLRYSNGKLLFSYNNNDRFYKLGELDLNANNIKLYDKDFSGGIISPVYANNLIYYLGNFSEYNKLMKFDENIKPQIKNISFTSKTIEKYNFTPEMELKKYNPIKYAKPWASWIPFFQINDTFPFGINGFGILSFMGSPSLDNFATLWLGFDIPSKFLQTELNLISSSLLYPLNFSFDSKVIYLTYNKYWKLGSSIDMQFRLYTGSDKVYFGISPIISGALFSENVRANDNSSAFKWKYNSWSLTTTLLASFNFNVNSDKPYRDDLIRLALYTMYSAAYNKLGLDFSAQFQTRYIPLRMSFYGAYVLNGIASFDGASRIFASKYVSAPPEFHAYAYQKNLKDNYFLAGDIELLGYIDSSFNLSHIYFDNFFASLSYRFAYYDKDYMHSVALKVGADAGIPIGYFNLQGEPYIMLAFRIPKTIEGFQKISINDFYFGVGLQISW
ncbi:TreP protein [Brachyspira aalborgi]|uniref:TreP protein n=1 Tax=Brachyspira aalborgi TaxID=29522 RepID=A0ABY3K5U0_9SPIR|nr:TreP protein [Brachyspira aalborgi]TXJ30600.1 TreP protein [Brachyspira aalborgi]TXJ45095.1 TreP protein [Brachyspira aalborgi]